MDCFRAMRQWLWAYRFPVVTEWKNTVLAIIFSDPSKARKMTDLIARMHLCQLHCKYYLLKILSSMISCYTELLSCAKKKKLQQLKSKKKKAKKKQFRAILEIDMLKWLKLTGKLSSSKLLMYFRSSDTRFCLEIMFLKPNTHCRSQYSFKD